MIIKNIEQKVKLAKLLSILSFAFSFAIVILMMMFLSKQLSESRKSIYILDKDIPILAKQTDESVNRPVEYKAHVNVFHSLFFTLTPDNKYIEYQMKKAMYLIDESGIQQYNNLKEKGLFNQILSSSAVLTIQTDSIFLDVPSKFFRYYGKQRIERKSSIVVRSLITEGYLKDVPRSQNNPHGVLIERWKTIENKDLKNEAKNNF
ncbi:conjugative transposon protein TraK [Sunxiuqinia elliptica]|uniref:Conjugative transposon TraK protein n=1 Tax=Sunxiuqinia elliptica TaxID=655355 RepID=A0A4R6H203_9BACT|nr:conjugative transposon protein TraK [Sunxiuqinia elliptica]TDO01401.1 conjugative transposon TraK protein [Sunxiuqinia elliptica]TDO57912.1 conjugative transposon TraK protein [Sunxiuqinia elliptica]